MPPITVSELLVPGGVASPMIGPINRESSNTINNARPGIQTKLPGAFRQGLTVGVNASLHNWQVAQRFLNIEDDEDKISQSEFERIAAGRDIKFVPGMTESEARRLIVLHDSENLALAIKQRGGVTDAAAEFVGILAGSLLDPINIGTILASGGIGLGLKALNSAGKLTALARGVNSVRRGGFVGAAAASVGAIPLDIALTKAAGQREFTLEDGIATVVGGTIIGGSFDLAIGKIASGLRARRERINARTRIDEDVDPEVMDLVNEESVSNLEPSTPEENATAVRNLNRAEDDGTVTRSSREQEGVDELPRDAEKMIEEQRQAFVETQFTDDATIDFSMKTIPNPIVNGRALRFANDVDKALYRIGQGDEQAFNELRDRLLANGLDPDESTIRQVAADVVNDVETRFRRRPPAPLTETQKLRGEIVKQDMDGLGGLRRLQNRLNERDIKVDSLDEDFDETTFDFRDDNPTAVIVEAENEARQAVQILKESGLEEQAIALEKDNNNYDRALSDLLRCINGDR